MKIGDKVAVIAGTQRGKVGVIVPTPAKNIANWDYWVAFVNTRPFGFMKEDLIPYDHWIN